MHIKGSNMRLALGPTYPILPGQYSLAYRCMTKKRKLSQEKTVALPVPKAKKYPVKLPCPR